jgi:mono/diheme cytochrome c family protein
MGSSSSSMLTAHSHKPAPSLLIVPGDDFDAGSTTPQGLHQEGSSLSGSEAAACHQPNAGLLLGVFSFNVLPPAKHGHRVSLQALPGDIIQTLPCNKGMINSGLRALREAWRGVANRVIEASIY